MIHPTFGSTTTREEPYSGIGKSALVYEINRPISALRGFFIQGKHEQFQRSIPYFAWTQAFSGLVKLLLMETQATLVAMKKKILKAVGSNGKVLTDIIPNLELVIGPQPDVPKLGDIESRNRLENILLRFVEAVADHEHPLVVFLDDLQWVDLPSLMLIKLLLADTELTHLLIIGAYRNNEVDSSHHLMMMVVELEKAGASMTQMSLHNLAEKDICTLISDTLQRPVHECIPLAKMTDSKTSGNPFFVKQFLQTLWDEQAIFFDDATHRWQWDEARIWSLNITDNVVEFMISKLRRLPVVTQEALKLAACIGNRFDITVLSLAANQSESEVQQGLTPAFKGEIVLPTKDGYKFSHDRIQQAAYALIDKQTLPGIHTVIGNIIKERANATGELNDYIFDIIYHLNEGEIGQGDRLKELVSLNVQAAKLAKAVTAYDAAYDYLCTAERLLDQAESFDQAARIEVNSSLAHICYLKRDYEPMKLNLAKVKKYAEDTLDMVNAWDVRLLYLASVGEQGKTIPEGIAMLKELGVILDEKINPIDLSRLMDLPLMSDPYKLAAMRILNQVITPAWSADPDAFEKICITMTNLSFRHGNCPESAIGYAFYGGLLCGQGDIERGYQLGKLGAELAEKLQAIPYIPRAQVLFYATVMHWRKPLQETVRLFYQTYAPALTVGDLEYACAGLAEPGNYEFLMGSSLIDLCTRYEDSFKKINLLKQYFQIRYLAPAYQAALNLSGQSHGDPIELTGEIFDHRKSIDELIANNHLTLLCVSYMCMTITAFIMGEYEQALEYAEQADRYKSGGGGMYYLVAHNFYHSLSLLQHCAKCPEEEVEKLLEKVAANQQELEPWARHSPENTEHKFILIQAEIARVKGQTHEALQLYEKVFDKAQENHYIHEQGLAFELAAHFHISIGMNHSARGYLQNARDCYAQWQALAKVKQMETAYGQWLTLIQSDSAQVTTMTSLDMHSVIKASQAIAGEIELSKLLTKMMDIIIESAGAKKGYLLTKEHDQWVVSAKRDASEENVQLYQSTMLNDDGGVSTAVVYYVERTRQALVLHDAIHDENFISDKNIQKNKSLSILCLPLMNQGSVSGLLYMENDLIRGAFTEERLELLKTLSSQMAVSLENALLYRDMEVRVQQRTIALAETIGQLEEAKKKAEAANQAKSAFLANMSHELRTPLNAVLGFSQLMSNDKGLSPDQKSKLDIINRSGKHLLQLINDVLDMSKIEAGKARLDQENINLFALIRDVTNMLRVRAEEKGLQLLFDQEPGVPRFIRGDAPKIRQVIINLIGNAVKFTEKGSVNLRMAAENDESGDILLRGMVMDTGRGISPDDLERIFLPFEQLDGSNEQNGTGLGLAITRQFVEMMNGEIYASSQLGKGSTFSFTIRVKPGDVEQSEAQERQDRPRVIGLAKGQQAWRILIAEDLEENQLLLRQLLETVGFDVRIAEDGEKAVQLFKSWHPHFIWMDRRMPRMYGLIATRNIRELPGGDKVKIVVLSASVLQVQREEELKAVSDDFIRKPYRSEEIYECMARHLNIEYIYDGAAETSRVIILPDTEALKLATTSLPDSLQHELRSTSAILDIERTNIAIEKIREHKPDLADYLKRRLDDFDFESICKLVGEE